MSIAAMARCRMHCSQMMDLKRSSHGICASGWHLELQEPWSKLELIDHLVLRNLYVLRVLTHSQVFCWCFVLERLSMCLKNSVDLSRILKTTYI